LKWGLLRSRQSWSNKLCQRDLIQLQGGDTWRCSRGWVEAPTWGAGSQEHEVDLGQNSFLRVRNTKARKWGHALWPLHLWH
jgi:hypothetical protein